MQRNAENRGSVVFQINYFEGVDQYVNGAVIGDVDMSLSLFLLATFLLDHTEQLELITAFVNSLLNMVDPQICVFFRFAADDFIS